VIGRGRVIARDRVIKTLMGCRTRQLEVNSDKYTFLGACLLLVLVLWAAVASVINLVSGSIQSHPRTWFNYLAVIVFSFGWFNSLRDPKLRRAYPYGMVGVGLFIAEFALEMALPRNTSGLLATLPSFLGLIASALALVEIGRWVRAKVRIAKSG
jgi:hypothetical protein